MIYSANKIYDIAKMNGATHVQAKRIALDAIAALCEVLGQDENAAKLDAIGPQVFKFKNPVRNYDCTNKVACIADEAPDANWIPADASILDGLTKLYIENNVEFYGHL